MTLEIISPEYTSVHEIAWIELNTTKGNQIIYRGHVPTILILSNNKEATFKLKIGKQQTITIASGIAEITRNSVTLLINENI